MASKDITFYAVWKPITHKVSYDPNGGKFRGSKDVTETSENEGDTIKVPEAATRDGYTFIGWVVNGTLYEPGDEFTVEEDVTFVALWEKNEDPDDPDEPDKPKKKTKVKSKKKSKTPQTGDATDALMWYILMSGMMSSMLMISMRRRKSAK